MINGVHAMFYTSEPEATRTFLRDKLGLSGTDIGRGWIIFDVPTAEVACHPSDESGTKGAPSGTHNISFYCDDIEATVDELTSKGVEFVEKITDTGFGLVTFFMMPGDLKIMLYQAKYGKDADA